MPLIKPRTRGKHVIRRSVKFELENDQTTSLYARFIGESRDYVINEAVHMLATKCKDFRTWCETDADACASPSPVNHAGRQRRRRRIDPLSAEVTNAHEPSVAHR